MLPYIVKQAQEGSKKTIIFKLKFGIFEKIGTFVFLFIFIFIPLIKFNEFSPAGKAGYITSILFLTPIIIFWVVSNYKGEVRLTKDVSDGSLTIERGIFKRESYTLKREEKPELRLIGDGAVWPFIKIKTYSPMIISDRARIMIDPGKLGETKLTKWYRYRLFAINHLWIFTEKDIKNISDYLDIPINPELGKYFGLEMKECYERDSDPNKIQKYFKKCQKYRCQVLFLF